MSARRHVLRRLREAGRGKVLREVPRGRGVGRRGAAFDERVPGNLVVACELVRRMKRGLAEGVFWAVVGEFHRVEREGREFDKRALRENKGKGKIV